MTALRRHMLMLLKLPITMVQIVIYMVWGFADVLRGRKRLRVEKTVLINAPRDAVWRFISQDRIVLDGPPVKELIREPAPEGGDLYLNRVLVNGQEWTR